MSQTLPSLLVVEDDGELRELLARLLSDEGYLVDTAPDGQAGLHRALTRRYGAMVIDRGLPGIDGLDLMGRLRALLRRNWSAAEQLQLGAGRLDRAVRAVRLPDGTEVGLSDREMVLLETLAGRPSRVFTRDELKERVFPTAEADSIVDTYVHYLRRKLGIGAVRTVRGIGYRAGTL